MKPDSDDNEININIPELKFWDNQDDLELKESIIQRQNKVEKEMKEQAQKFEPTVTQLISGMVEIADIILKNTCGIGSNFKLAECELSAMTPENIQRFYSHVLSVLGYHFGQMVPEQGDAIWTNIESLLDDQQVGQLWKRKLAVCLDHESGVYSAVRAGRLLWEEVGQLFEVKNWDKNTTARIYYQTAPGQDLIYVIESIDTERWSSSS